MSTRTLLFSIFFAFFTAFLLSFQSTLVVTVCQDLAQKVGETFLNALMMGVVPLIVLSIMSGAMRMAMRDDFFEIGPKVVSVFLMNSFTSAALSFIVFIILSPSILPHHFLESAHVVAQNSMPIARSFEIFPKNIFRALVELNMVGIVIFGLFFGGCLGNVLRKHPDRAQSLSSSLNLLNEAIVQMIRIVMKAMPVGVYALILDASLKMNWHSIYALSAFLVMFFITVFCYLSIWALVLNKFVIRSVWLYISQIRPALFSAFSTSSSVVALPVALDVLENDCKISSDLTRFVMPLGITVNMAGTTMFVTMAALYLSTVSGMPQTVASYTTIFLVSWFTSLGIAGVPSGCLVALMLVLHHFGIPESSMALLIGIDRFLDMIRTSLNMFGNMSSVHLLSAWTAQKNSQD